MTELAPLIGLGGRLRSGKDTVADHLVSRYGFIKIGMSEPLNDALLTLNPLIPVNAHEDQTAIGLTGQFVRYSDLIDRVGYVEAKRNPEVRALLQRLGTDVGRKLIDENVWVDMMARIVTDHLDAGTPVVVTGIRYLNEVDVIRDMLGSSWWVSRPITSIGVAADQILAHESERGVNEADFDKVIRNDGTLDELYRSVDLMLYATMPYLFEERAA